MIRLLTTIAFTFALTLCIGQTYSYSFHGDLDNSSATALENRIMEMPNVTSCKAKIKSDSGKGELLITIIRKESTGEGSDQFKARELKELLLSYGLEPNQFIRIKE